MAAEREADVVVVGGGPVGLTGALLLARYGLRVEVFEREARLFPHPRAIHLDGDAVRLVQALGLWDELASTTAHVAGMTFRGAEGQELFTIGASDGDDPAAEHGTVFWQPALDAALRDALAQEPTATLHPSTTVERIQPVSGGACVVARGADREHRVCAHHVLACDGANSPTRRRLGIGLETLGPSARWLVVDAHVRRPARLPALAQQFCDPARPATYVPGAGTHRRWEFRWPERHEPTTAEVAALLSAHVDPSTVEVIRAAVYRFRSALARRWRRGPVLLAGDAAHQMPPFLGQGLASGLRDVKGIAWRMALAHRGAAPSPLLDAWEAERHTHVRTVIQRTAAAGRLIQLRRGSAARDRAFQLLGRFPALIERAARHAAAHPPLLSGPGGTGGHLAGHLAPAGSVATPHGTESLDRTLLSGFAVLAARPLPPASREAWQQAGGHVLAPTSPALRAWAGERPVVLRPDGYAYGTCGAGDIPQLTSDLREALGASLSLPFTRAAFKP